MAVKTSSTSEKAKFEKLATVKKKTVKTFFQNMTQRVLERKIAKRLKEKSLKGTDDDKAKLGGLSIMFSILVFFAILLSPQYGTLAFFALLFGLIGLILGVVGIRREKKKTMSAIGIFLGGLWLFIALIMLSS